jgi:hypothetical protein
MIDDQASDDLRIARHALISAVAGYAGMLAVMIAVNIAIARRDQLRRIPARARRWLRPPVAVHDADALLAMRADVDQVTHADLSKEQP